MFFKGVFDEGAIRRVREDVWSSLDEESKEFYGERYLDAMNEAMISSAPTMPDDLTPVIRAVRSGLLSKRPFTYYPAGSGCRIVIYLNSFLPTWMMDVVANKLSIIVNEKPAHMSQ